MDPLVKVTGIAVPLERSNVDTDQIIPAVYLKRITKTGFDDVLFAAWRKDPDFVLNKPEYARASILVAGPDFGIGSSREHAVWALRDYGFRVVISPRFADIFRGNAGKQGMLAAVVSPEEVLDIQAWLVANPGAEITVDLETRTVTYGNQTVQFLVDDYTRWRLMEGLDDISLTLLNETEITDFEAKRANWLPNTTPR